MTDRDTSVSRELLSWIDGPLVVLTQDSEIVDMSRAAMDLFGGELAPSKHEIREALAEPLLWLSHHADQTWSGTITAGAQSIECELRRWAIGNEPAPRAVLLAITPLESGRSSERTMRGQEELLQNLAHQIRGPLAVLEGLLEMLADLPEAMSMADREQLLTTARQSMGRVQIVLDDLLAAGSIQAGRLEVQPQALALSTLIEDALAFVEHELVARRQRVSLVTTAEDLTMLADPRYIRYVLVNLLENAAKYGPEGEQILLRAESLEEFARISVSDRGPGIPLGEQKRIFERFYRASANPQEPGIGLGLAIAKGIVGAHGGAMGLESATGVGTTVWFTLPLCPTP